MDAKKSMPALPPDAWAVVMEYLPLSEAVTLSSTCRAAYDAVPLVSTLHITETYEINCRATRRFQGVRDMFIYSLVKYDLLDTDEDDKGYNYLWGSQKLVIDSIDYETTIRAAPFLSNNFKKLERVFFGGRADSGDEEELIPFVATPDEEDFEDLEEIDSHHTNISRVFDSLSAAFRCGALPQTLSIKGLRCIRPWTFEIDDEDAEVECPICIRAAMSFPIRSVACFECCGSSKNGIEPGRSHDLDVCLDKHKVEEILETRPGGHALLHSNYRLRRLLERGICTPYGLPFYHIVHYSDSQLEEIDRVIKYAQLDCSLLDSSDLNKAIGNSIVTDVRRLPSSNHTCLLSDKSREYLATKLSISIKEDSRHLHLSASKFLKSEILELECDTPIALVLLSRFIIFSGRSAIQEVVSSDVVPALIKWALQSQQSKPQIVNILATVLVGTSDGIDHDTKMKWTAVLCTFALEGVYSSSGSIDTRIIPFIVQAISSSSKCIRSMAVYILSEIVSHENESQIESVVVAGAVHNVISHLNQSCEDFLAKPALSLLAVVVQTRTYLDKILEAGIMKTMSTLLNKCGIAMWQEWIRFSYKIVMEEPDPLLFQEIVDTGCVAELIQSLPKHDMLMYSEVVGIISVILVHLQQSHVIGAMVEAGALPVLVGFVRKNRGSIVENALIALKNIAKTSEPFLAQVLDTGLVNHLGYGMKAELSNVRKGWIDLVHSLVSSKCSHPVLQELVGSGAISNLVDLIQAETDEHVKLRTRRILMKGKALILKRETERIDLLQKKRALLMVDEWHKEVELLKKKSESLRIKLLESEVKEVTINATRKRESTSLDIKHEFEQVSSRLLTAQGVIRDLNDDANKLVSVGEHGRDVDEYCLPFIEDIDTEIRRSKLRIQELSSPFYASKSRVAEESKRAIKTTLSSLAA